MLAQYSACAAVLRIYDKQFCLIERPGKTQEYNGAGVRKPTDQTHKTVANITQVDAAYRAAISRNQMWLYDIDWHACALCSRVIDSHGAIGVKACAHAAPDGMAIHLVGEQPSSVG